MNVATEISLFEFGQNVPFVQNVLDLFLAANILLRETLQGIILP